MSKKETPVYKDAAQPLGKRVDDLISRMTLKEKVSQMIHSAPPIERLDVPEYDWWNECLHGVGRAGIATVFPQAIGLAAAWNAPLMHRVAVAISDEARAKHHEALRKNIHDRYTGLTFWSPNINIFRDPRWGRGQESYGEDPYLTARLGVAFVKGLQGDNPKYLKLVATPKHYAVHSGPEADRHHFDARVNPRDLRETYLPAFKATVQEGGAVSIMGAYNRTNGEACCASITLLQKILREEWGFDGYVVSDCGAIDDIYKHHQLVKTAEAAAAVAVKNGCELNCGNTYLALLGAVEQGLIDEATLDLALKRLFTARFRLGMFDLPEAVPYAQIPITVNDSPAHRALALEVARESMVLLKNANELLPLKKTLKTIAVIGPNADSVPILLGNYNGTPSKAVTPLEGIRANGGAIGGAQVLYAKGCEVLSLSKDGFAEAVEIAKKADVAILCLGLSQRVEGEEGQREGVEGGGHSTGDREQIDLPGVQEELLKAVHATGTPVVLVLLNGSAVALNWAAEHVPAILEAWYPGEEGGAAIADVLFGDYNPGGRLPVTFPKSLAQLPPFEDYAMQGRTYRFSTETPLYPFGYGLSYTTFKYRGLRISRKKIAQGKGVRVSVEVENVGQRAGDEVVQLYVRDLDASAPTPLLQLQGFARVHLAPGEKKRVSFALKPEQLVVYDDRGQPLVEPGEFEVSVGGGQPGYAETLIGRFEVE